QRKGVSYGNDDMRVMWNVTLAPKDLQNFAKLLLSEKFLSAAEDRKGTEGSLTHSLSVLDTGSAMRPNFYEVFLNAQELTSFLNTYADQLALNNKSAAGLLREYSRMFSAR